MESTTATEDRSDTKRALAALQPSGELYIVEYCSLWRNQECIGTRIIASAGPIVFRDLYASDDWNLGVFGTPIPREVFDNIDDWQDLTEDDAEGMQAEEDAGRVSYPIGAR